MKQAIRNTASELICLAQVAHRSTEGGAELTQANAVYSSVTAVPEDRH